MKYFVFDLHFKTGLILLALIFTITLMFDIFAISRSQKISVIRIVLMFFISVYIVFFIKFVILPVWVFYDAQFLESLSIPLSSFVQCIPLTTITSSFKNGNWVRQVIGNIVLLVPIPIFIELLTEKEHPFKKVLLIGLAVSFGIEFIQGIISLLTHYPSHIVDIDDVILNLAGISLSFLLLKYLRKTRLFIYTIKR